jgi:hypothetical protein
MSDNTPKALPVPTFAGGTTAITLTRRRSSHSTSRNLPDGWHEAIPCR